EPPDKMPRRESPRSPIRGAMKRTAANSRMHGPTTATNRRSDRPPVLSGRDDIAASAIGSFENGDGDFKDFIQMFGSENRVRNAICHKFSGTHCHHAA